MCVTGLFSNVLCFKIFYESIDGREKLYITVSNIIIYFLLELFSLFFLIQYLHLFVFLKPLSI
jgi:hypothetical protein